MDGTNYMNKVEVVVGIIDCEILRKQSPEQMTCRLGLGGREANTETPLRGIGFLDIQFSGEDRTCVRLVTGSNIHPGTRGYNHGSTIAEKEEGSVTR
jgi:hypothetical protein